MKIQFCTQESVQTDNCGVSAEINYSLYVPLILISKRKHVCACKRIIFYLNVQFALNSSQLLINCVTQDEPEHVRSAAEADLARFSFFLFQTISLLFRIFHLQLARGCLLFHPAEDIPLQPLFYVFLSTFSSYFFIENQLMLACYWTFVQQSCITR